MTLNPFNNQLDSQQLSSTNIKFQCTNCPQNVSKKFDSIRGLKIHNTRCHPDLPPLIIPNISEVTLSNNAVTEDDFLRLFTLKSKVGVLRRIPKGARKQAAKTFVQLIRNCIAYNDPSSWYQLFSFSYKAFHIPVQNKKDKARSLVAIVKENISSMQLPPTHVSKLKSAEFYQRIEKKLSDFDVRGAIRLMSSTDSFAPLNTDTLNSLYAKHPQPSSSTTPPPKPASSDDCLQVTDIQVKRAISSFASGSAAGPDGFRPQFLKDLTSISAGNAGTEVLTAVTELCNFMLRGQVNEAVCKYLYGASLCALCKKCGGIRPIAIGLSIRRLTSKLAVSHSKETIGDFFGAKQLGFGVGCGCEAAVHATKSHVTKNSNTTKVTLKIDYNNAFNTVQRNFMLSRIKVKTPKLYNYIWQCYANSSVLCYDSNVIQSSSGIQQGDPGGSFLFPLSIHHIVDDMESELNVWYQDDGTLSDYPDVVLEDFAHLINLSKDIGLVVNPSKCELHFSSGHIDSEVMRKFETLAPGIQVIEDENFNLLGAAIFDSGFEIFAAKILEKVHNLLHHLKNLSAHSAFYLLKNCFAIPKLNFFIRSTPAWKHSHFLDTFDNDSKTTIESILNIEMNHQIWLQASLPTSYGGIGIRKLNDIALSAFLSSAFGTMDLVSQILHSSDVDIISKLPEVIDRWNATNSSIPSMSKHQKNWDRINVTRIINEMNLSEPLDIACFSALQCKESNAWINVIPSKHIGTFLNDTQIRVCIALRLGAPICRPHICSCGTFVSERGIHGLSCQKSAGRIPRHIELNNILCQALSSIHINATLEPPGLFRDDGKRPDGLTLVPWANGRFLVWDATCWDTLAPTYLSKSTKSARSVAEMASSAKHDKYRELKNNNYIFNAVAVETLGPWSTDAQNLINKIGSKLNEISGDSRSLQFLRQRIALAIQRDNVSSILCTIPSSTGLEDVFYL